MQDKKHEQAIADFLESYGDSASKGSFRAFRSKAVNYLSDTGYSLSDAKAAVQVEDLRLQQFWENANQDKQLSPEQVTNEPAAARVSAPVEQPTASVPGQTPKRETPAKPSARKSPSRQVRERRRQEATAPRVSALQVLFAIVLFLAVFAGANIARAAMPDVAGRIIVAVGSGMVATVAILAFYMIFERAHKVPAFSMFAAMLVCGIFVSVVPQDVVHYEVTRVRAALTGAEPEPTSTPNFATPKAAIRLGASVPDGWGADGTPSQFKSTQPVLTDKKGAFGERSYAQVSYNEAEQTVKQEVRLGANVAYTVWFCNKSQYQTIYLAYLDNDHFVMNEDRTKAFKDDTTYLMAWARIDRGNCIETSLIKAETDFVFHLATEDRHFRGNYAEYCISRAQMREVPRTSCKAGEERVGFAMRGAAQERRTKMIIYNG